MPYTTNEHSAKVRTDAVRLVKEEYWSMRKVARRFGVEPSTVMRWCRRKTMHTLSSRPHKSPTALPPQIISAIIKKRNGRRRCGQHIYQELKREGVEVSLPSVQRTLDRCGLLKKRSPWKRPHDATLRPEVTHAGSLLQIDTVHIRTPLGGRMYVYTLIDLYSRWAYAEAIDRISAERSARFVKRAAKGSPFSFQMIQSDHGAEFSTWFTHVLQTHCINHRHSRVRKPNDNAHIERFNRTLQEECLDLTAHTILEFRKALKQYLLYYNTQRIHMGIDYQTPEEVLRRS